MIEWNLKIGGAGVALRKRELRNKLLEFMPQYDDLDVDTAIEILKEIAEDLDCLSRSVRLTTLRQRILEHVNAIRL